MRLLLLLLLSTTAGQAAAQNAKEEKEVRCLALNIYFEARGEPTDGQFAVGLVTMNRVQSPRYPDSVCEVVWQPRQFSWTHDGKSDHPYEQQAWDRAQHIANFIYHKYRTLPERARAALDRTKGALHYYAPKLADPYWARLKQITFSAGGHVFLRGNS